MFASNTIQELPTNQPANNQPVPKEYQRLVGKWVFDSVVAAKGLARTARYQKWDMEFYIERASQGGSCILTRHTVMKAKVMGLSHPFAGDYFTETYSLVEAKSSKEKLPSEPMKTLELVFERKFKVKVIGRGGGPTHWRSRILSKGNGVFEDSTRHRVLGFGYPRWAELAGEYYRMELDETNETLIYKQSNLYGGVVKFRRAA